MGQIIRKRKEWDPDWKRAEYKYVVIDSMGDTVEVTGVCVFRDDDKWELAIWIGRDEKAERIFDGLLEAKTYFKGYCILEAWLDWDR